MIPFSVRALVGEVLGLAQHLDVEARIGGQGVLEAVEGRPATRACASTVWNELPRR